MRTYHEPGRQVPVVEEADVFVAGGGPAGGVAAIAAARLGDAAGCLGGMWTAGALGWIIDAANKPGIMREITLEMDRRGARYKPPEIKTIDVTAGAAGARDFAYDPEELKLALEEMCSRAGVCLQLHTRVVGAHVDAQRRVKLALTESKSGREAWAAKVFIDGTGDGDVAARTHRLPQCVPWSEVRAALAMLGA
jgi:flavin-dependent dehydrogenase